MVQNDQALWYIMEGVKWSCYEMTTISQDYALIQSHASVYAKQTLEDKSKKVHSTN